MKWEVGSRGNDKPLILLGIYHPPLSKNNMHTTQTFTNECSKFYMELAVKFKNILLLGDFNIHVNNPDKGDAKQFIEMCYAVGLQQHMKQETHISGNTLFSTK